MAWLLEFEWDLRRDRIDGYLGQAVPQLVITLSDTTMRVRCGWGKDKLAVLSLHYYSSPPFQSKVRRSLVN
jgi:hypothetical protein